jgi:hypothetical protein
VLEVEPLHFFVVFGEDVGRIGNMPTVAKELKSLAFALVRLRAGRAIALGFAPSPNQAIVCASSSVCVSTPDSTRARGERPVKAR